MAATGQGNLTANGQGNIIIFWVKWLHHNLLSAQFQTFDTTVFDPV